MARIAPYTFFQEFDNNGDPLAGGLLYAYEAGTSTPKETYTDSSEGTINANPVVLDASGRADVWLGTGGYKLTLRTSAGVLIKEVDNIVGEASNVFGASVTSVSTNTAITEIYKNGVINCTSTVTLSLIDVATAGQGFLFTVKNSGDGIITLDPDAAELIDGVASIVLYPTQSCIVICDGTGWVTAFVGQYRENKYDATTAPTTGDDSNDGYAAGSVWYDTTNDEAYICLDATVGAAVWVEATLTTSDLGTSATKDFIDDDTMATASATTTASSESIKAYVDASIPTTTTPWVAYTPIFTGFGTVSGVAIYSRRVGDTLEIRGKFVGGTSTATEARLSLGFNGVEGSLTIASTKVPTGTSIAGAAGQSVSTVEQKALCEPSVGYLTFGIINGGAGVLSKQNGNFVLSSGNTLSIMVSVPITGW